MNCGTYGNTTAFSYYRITFIQFIIYINKRLNKRRREIKIKVHCKIVVDTASYTCCYCIQNILSCTHFSWHEHKHIGFNAIWRHGFPTTTTPILHTQKCQIFQNKSTVFTIFHNESVDTKLRNNNRTPVLVTPE